MAVVLLKDCNCRVITKRKTMCRWCRVRCLSACKQLLIDKSFLWEERNTFSLLQPCIISFPARLVGKLSTLMGLPGTQDGNNICILSGCGVHFQRDFMHLMFLRRHECHWKNNLIKAGAGSGRTSRKFTQKIRHHSMLQKHQELTLQSLIADLLLCSQLYYVSLLHLF